MNIKFVIYGLVTLTVITDVFADEAVAVFKWPKQYKAAVSLSYDDALNSQLINAVPALDKYGFKASFYLTLSNPNLTTNIEQWRQVATNGHELGNHTLYHPCRKSISGRDWVMPYHDLDTKVISHIRQEVLLANTLLHAIDNKNSRTFTPPCGDFNVSDGNYINAIRDSFIAIKGYNPQYDPKFDLLLMPENVSGETLIAFVNEVQSQGGLANIVFHGIEGDYLTVSDKAHNELLQYLAENKDRLWVDTYSTIMNYVKTEHGF
ncbi:polysaccharide deacetylase family protein [Shewanella sp. HL-SH5]|uniref:polysaccharide deacetylase family protein n=1 Tax=Shewanella sp. HL-SH5 TaxID=3436241 RepID=UPI003EBCC64F